VNLPLLALYDACGMDVEILAQPWLRPRADRALTTRFDLDLSYDHVYVDLDDTLVCGDAVNPVLVAFLYQSANCGRTLTLLTRHAAAVADTLARHRLSELFDTVHHIRDGAPKSAYIDSRAAIYIDDSFRERAEVARTLGVPVFSPDAVACLMDYHR
jgi:carbamoyl-phosphate synthase large subunit